MGKAAEVATEAYEGLFLYQITNKKIERALMSPLLMRPW